MKKDRIKLMLTHSFYLMLLAIVLVFYLFNPSAENIFLQDKEQVPVVISTQDIERGQYFSEDNILVVPKDASKITTSDAILRDASQLYGAKALTDLRKGESIYDKDVLFSNDFDDGTVEYVIEFKNTELDVAKNDYLNVNVSYPRGDENITGEFVNFDIVLPMKSVNLVKDKDGLTAKEAYAQEKKFIPNYIIVSLTKEDIDYIEDAQKYGEIFVTKYEDETITPDSRTYVMRNERGDI